MPEYRRALAPGGTFFFTLVTEGRAPILAGESSRSLLRAAFTQARSKFPFTIDALVLLPDHLQCPLNEQRPEVRWPSGDDWRARAVGRAVRFARGKARQVAASTFASTDPAASRRRG